MPEKKIEKEAVDDLTAVIKIIKNQMAALDRAQKELGNHKEMVEDTLENNPHYREASQEAKEASKIKSDVKRQILDDAKLSPTVAKIKELTAYLKETRASLSDYLVEYQRLSGSNQIEGDDGETAEIVYVAKLKKIRQS
ncbi:MAG: hypothetical protein M1352_00210 [Patescibacteria group bacterium]|nr:hypothetical protein [Patescibacteria group bacterium]